MFLPSLQDVGVLTQDMRDILARDRKSTRLNSSHQIISYAVFCLKKKNIHRHAHSIGHPLIPTHATERDLPDRSPPCHHRHPQLAPPPPPAPTALLPSSSPPPPPP